MPWCGAPGLLQRDDVEAGVDFGDARHGMPVPLGESLGPATHLFVSSPNARTFQVASTDWCRPWPGLCCPVPRRACPNPGEQQPGGVVVMASSNHAGAPAPSRQAASPPLFLPLDHAAKDSLMSSPIGVHPKNGFRAAGAAHVASRLDVEGRLLHLAVTGG